MAVDPTVRASGLASLQRACTCGGDPVAIGCGYKDNAAMSQTRIEKDSIGSIAVPADRYWGAQTQRSLENFAIGIERMPIEVVRAICALPSP